MKKIILGILICFMIIITNSFAFSDLPESHWAYDEITFMSNSGIINGFPDGTFKPDEPATREQTATIFKNFFGFALKEKIKTFEDVNEGAWSKNAIDIASQYLYDEDSVKFRPSEITLRIEAAEAILRYLGLENDQPDLALIEDFADKDSFNEKDKKTIALIVENGIMKGDGKAFNPKFRLSRAEICTLLCNAFDGKDDLLVKNDGKTVLTVNGEDVTVAEFKLYFKLQRKMYELITGRNDLWYNEIEGVSLYSVCKDSVKDEIINTKINLQKAEELGLKLDNETQNKILKELESENSKNVCEYYNITLDDLRKINEESALMKLFAETVYSELDHTTHNHADINELQDEITYSARHILVLNKNKTEEQIEEAKNLALEILDRVKNGEDFATLASQYSQDAGSNQNGGLYENIKLGQFVKEFEYAALENEIGEIYPELVESTYGYHIIKTESKKIEKIEMSEEAKNEIINFDFKEKSLDWINSANIQIYEDVYKRI